jgi:hypothetical protein
MHLPKKVPALPPKKAIWIKRNKGIYFIFTFEKPKPAMIAGFGTEINLTKNTMTKTTQLDTLLQ